MSERRIRNTAREEAMPEDKVINALEAAAYLLTIVEVDKSDRVQCQAEGCGHSVYKRIHVVLVGLEFKVLGSECYQRLYGHADPAAATPQYGTGAGRLLTAEERRSLVENTARFIEALEAERLELERHAALEAARREQVEIARAAAPQRWMEACQEEPEYQQPQHIPDDDRSASYEGAEMLRWRWRRPEECAASMAAYQAGPSPGPYHGIVMKCFQGVTKATPYLFALEVEMRNCLPKSYTFRSLDELNLIERL
jgi:hypothetical protein